MLKNLGFTQEISVSYCMVVLQTLTSESPEKLRFLSPILNLLNKNPWMQTQEYVF